ncbi:MAG: hypothetical protein IKW50_05100 [Oscillospiraceae bacterium]|nr:hypothetical protein [Oscillospiraceae bacterium]
MNEKDFDLDFDFEKEYGFDTPEDTDEQLSGEDFDLKALLESDFGEDISKFTSEYETNFDYGPETVDYAQDEGMVLPEAPVEEQPYGDEFDAELPEEMMNAQPLPVEEPAPYEEVQPEAMMPEELPREEKPVRPERRRQVSPIRRFKNETLPLIIAGVTAVLLLFFVIGSVGRLIGKIKTNNDAALKASEAAENEAERQDREAIELMEEADRVAAGYDYDTAIAMLEGFTGNKAKYPEMEMRLSEYKQKKSLLVAHNDPGAIPNLSFHVLVADPARTWNNKDLGGKYNRNFVTTDEFEKILEQLYNNGYVLVDMDCFIAETVTGETITYSAKPLYLPDGKKPVMITQTMVNYYSYMTDSNEDGVPDKDGAGFATKLVVQNGEVKAAMVNSAGETVIGNYDLVPILEDFIEKHPDFAYHGSRALLAVSGVEGVFGYRTNKSVIETKGQSYYDAEVAGAKEVVAALKEAGYTFASYTYGDEAYGKFDATTIQKDISKWTAEVLPILGTCDTLVFAKTSDISANGDYTTSKFNVLYGAGFRYYISHTTGGPSCKIAGNYVRQLRIMVTGTQMAHAANTYAKYFDSQSVLNSTRGNVPQ